MREHVPLHDLLILTLNLRVEPLDDLAEGAHVGRCGKDGPVEEVGRAATPLVEVVKEVAKPRQRVAEPRGRETGEAPTVSNGRRRLV